MPPPGDGCATKRSDIVSRRKHRADEPPSHIPHQLNADSEPSPIRKRSSQCPLAHHAASLVTVLKSLRTESLPDHHRAYQEVAKRTQFPETPYAAYWSNRTRPGGSEKSLKYDNTNPFLWVAHPSPGGEQKRARQHWQAVHNCVPVRKPIPRSHSTDHCRPQASHTPPRATDRLPG